MSWGDLRREGLGAQVHDWVDSAEGFRRAGVRVYKFEEEESSQLFIESHS